MSSIPSDPFASTSFPDETPADLVEAMDFFLADAADDLTDIELEELALREQERQLSEEIRRSIALNRQLSGLLAEMGLSGVTIPVLPIALAI